MKKIIAHILFWGITFILTACFEDDSCNQNMVSGINIEVITSDKNDSTDVDGLNPSGSIEWNIAPLNDSITFITSANQAYSTGVPLNLNDTSITIQLNIRDNDTTAYLTDIIKINYVQTDLRLVSVNCGFAPVFKITDIFFSTNALDSVLYSPDEVSNDLEIVNAVFYY